MFQKLTFWWLLGLALDSREGKYSLYYFTGTSSFLTYLVNSKYESEIELLDSGEALYLAVLVDLQMKLTSLSVLNSGFYFVCSTIMEVHTFHIWAGKQPATILKGLFRKTLSEACNIWIWTQIKIKYFVLTLILLLLGTSWRCSQCWHWFDWAPRLGKKSCRWRWIRDRIHSRSHDATASLWCHDATDSLWELLSVVSIFSHRPGPVLVLLVF